MFYSISKIIKIQFLLRLYAKRLASVSILNSFCTSPRRLLATFPVQVQWAGHRMDLVEYRFCHTNACKSLFEFLGLLITVGATSLRGSRPLFFRK